MVIRMKKYFSKGLCLVVFVLFFAACTGGDGKQDNLFHKEKPGSFCVDGIEDFKRGDIIVRPNLNLLPGSSQLIGGQNFGHAALVVKGFRHNNIDSLLSNTIIVESIAKDVSQAFQVREIAALTHHQLDAFNNVNFDGSKTGNRYRLRLNLTDEQIDSVIGFAIAQKGDFSSWNAAKRLPSAFSTGKSAVERADNSHWYCSLLVWQSVIASTGLDADVNGGYMVYPNDLINSPLFDNTAVHTGRARF